jgi:hypothetical protein
MTKATCFAIAIGFLLGGCTDQSPCTPGQTRCLGSSAQVCLASGEWREFENCADVGQRSGGAWQCGASSTVDGGVTCVGSGFCSATDPTPEMVRAFWSYMESVYGSTQIDKQDAPSMQLVADTLDLLGIQDKQTFLSRFTTTIGTHIYTPFDIGVPTPEYSLWGQIVICVHEHEHVAQYRAEGIDYLTHYLGSGADRADYEAEAYRTSAELGWWRARGVADAVGLADHLQAYNLTPGEIVSGLEIIQLSEDTIARGGLVSDATRTALEWLEANAPGLKVHS